MSDADAVFDSQAATLRAVSRESSSRHHQRRSSTSERIDEILEVRMHSYSSARVIQLRGMIQKGGEDLGRRIWRGYDWMDE